MLASLDGSGGFPARGSPVMAFGSASDARSRPRAASGSCLRETGAQSLGLGLEERLDLGNAGQPTAAEAPEPDAGRRRWADRGPGPAREQQPPPVGRRADPGRGVNSQPDVADIGERGTSAVDPHPDADLEI